MPAARTVHRLRLRAGSEAAARGMAIRFEDALRTASLPDAGGRLVFVRRLDLGRVDRASTSMTLSLLLADAFEREHPQCVHASGEDAEASPAVWFRDALQAHTLLALRIAAGQRCDAWFWRLVVPGIAGIAAPVSRLRGIALHLASHPEAPVALPHWAADLVRAGHLQALVAALDPPTVATLRSVTGVVAEHASASTPADAGAGRAIGVRERHAGSAADAPQDVQASTVMPVRQDGHAAQRPALRLLQAWLRGIGDDTVLALPGDDTLHARATPAASASTRTSTRRDAAPATRAAHADARLAATAGPAHAPSSASPAPQALRVPATARHAPPPDTVGAAASPGADAHAGIDSEPMSLDASRMPPRLRSDARHDAIDAAPTAIGGIGFLLNALERIGYAQWREAQPAWSHRPILARVFARALHAVDAPAHDPAWALAQGIATAGEAPRDFIAPERWRRGLAARGGAGWRHVCADALAWTDASHRLVLAATWGAGASDDATALPAPARGLPIASAPIMPIALGDPDHVVATAWSIALHRWLRRHARIGLVDLLRRPAWLSLTPTHLDLYFDPAHADLRVRRAGLDIDPGWLPWWERVVGFHYERRYGIGAPAGGTPPWA